MLNNAGPFLNHQQELLVNEILDLPYCYLGGSRRMKQKYPNDIFVTEKTDWDFYMKDSKTNRKHLLAKGFRNKCVPQHYKDKLCNDVFSHGALNVQVVLRKDVNIYRDIFESLSSDIYITRLWKSSKYKINKGMDSFTEGEMIKNYFDGLYSLHRRLFKL